MKINPHIREENEIMFVHSTEGDSATQLLTSVFIFHLAVNIFASCELRYEHRASQPIKSLSFSRYFLFQKSEISV